MSKKHTSRTFILIFWLLTSCSPALPGLVTVTPTENPAPTPTHVATLTPLPTDLPTPTPPALPPPPSLTPETSPPDTSSALQNITYTIEALFDYDNKTLLVNQKVTFTNHSGRPLETITMAVEPNRRGGIFRIERLGIDGISINNYTLEKHRLVFTPPVPIAHGASTQIELNYLLALPL
ncbi:MAG: hypothetical protein DDG60_14025, partial [Anaerolineae bacterium]